MTAAPSPRIIALISADLEWRAIRTLFPQSELTDTPFGEWFLEAVGDESVVFFHGGWGKIAAAASTQYAIDRWSPALLINLGTCGGFEGHVEKGTVILAERTIVYDIVEQMGDYDDHLDHYTTDIDLSWIGSALPGDVCRTLLVSGDRDLLVEEVPRLHERYGAVAGDWESGAIAWVAARNNIRCLILRGVTDLVGHSGGEAYGNIELYARNAAQVLGRLVAMLPQWVRYLGDRDGA